MRCTAEALHEGCVALLRALGVPPDQAEPVAAALVDADLRGVMSHGVRLVSTYARRLSAGEVAATAVVSIVRDHGSTVVLDGGLGLGQVAAQRAVELLVERTLRHGVAGVAVRETTHFGALGYFTEAAARQGVIALAFQNGPPMVPPHGGVTPLFATNPVSWAAPTGAGAPVVFDGATTAVAGNRVHQARRRGDAALPAGWMTDASGRPTTDIAAVGKGFLQWAGGHKGYGLALLVEVLAGVLAGSCYGLTERTASALSGRGRLAKGGLFLGLDPARFLEPGELAARLGDLAAQVRQSAPAAGVDRVLMPGDLEAERRARALADGIAIDEAVAAELDALADELHVARVSWS